MRGDDLPSVARLATQLGYPTTAVAVAERFAAIGGSADDYLCVAEVGALPVAGWIHLHVLRTLESDDQAEVLGLVVDAACRRQGIGRALVQDAEGWARARGLMTIRLRSNVVRREAHAFYRAVGYTIVKTQHAYEKPLFPIEQDLPPSERQVW